MVALFSAQKEKEGDAVIEIRKMVTDYGASRLADGNLTEGGTQIRLDSEFSQISKQGFCK
jgi:hypothetical protein